MPAPTPSPYRLELDEQPESEKPWILRILLHGEEQGVLRFETDDERNEFMRLFQGTE